MAGFTNKGKWRLLGWAFVNQTIPTNYYVILFTSATAPDQDSNTVSDHTEITAGNGYTTGGYSLTPGATDFDVHTEDDTGDLGKVQIKDIVWTATGGPIPSAGGGARYAALTDDNGTVANRELYAYWDLTSDRSVSSGQTLTLQDCELQLTET
jgi:hypothetical protein